MENRQQRRQLAKARAREVQLHIDAARKAISEGDMVAAERECQSAIGIDPLAASPYHLLAHIAYTQGRLQNAGDNILEAATRDDTNLDIHSDCGAIMNTLGRGAEAEAACRYVLEYNPEHIQARNNLSVALDLQGRWVEAVVECDVALSKQPTYVDALINKGSVLVKLGEPVRAIEVLSEAVKLAPENPLARVNLATALRHVGELVSARKQIDTAIELNPNYPEAHGTLGDILVADGEFNSALEAYDAALTHRPGFRAVRLNRAATLYKSGQLEEASAVYNSVLAEFKDSADAYAGLGTVHLASGRIINAIKAYRKAVTIDPRHGNAWAALAAAPGDVLTEVDIASMERLCSSDNVAPDSCIAAHFAMAEYFDKTKEYEKAFQNFEAGNQSRKLMMASQDQIFDFEALMADVERTINIFHEDLGQRERGNDDERLVFVIGMPRSGTSLIEQILATHPNVVGLGEAMSIARLPKDMDEGEMADRVLAQFSKPLMNAKRVVDKTPFHFHHVGLIRRLFPNSHIIHCQRDEMDRGLSCYMQNFVNDYPWSCDLEHIGLYTKAYKKLMAHWREILGDELIEINYEELVANPELSIRWLVAQIQLDWTPDFLDFHKTSRPVFSASSWQVRQPIYATAINRAKNYAAYLSALQNGLA